MIGKSVSRTIRFKRSWKKRIFRQTDQLKQDIRRKKPARIFKTESFHREGWWREDLQRPGSAQLWEWQTRRGETVQEWGPVTFLSYTITLFWICVHMYLSPFFSCHGNIHYISIHKLIIRKYKRTCIFFYSLQFENIWEFPYSNMWLQVCSRILQKI